jgi:uncharacterized damage-inducible protein DinB
MYRKLEEFFKDWAYESEATLKVFNNLTDESLNKNVGENIRTAGRLAWHITGAISELGHRMGLTFNKIDQDSPFPTNAKEIVDEYKHASDGLLREIKEKWNDDTLSIEDVTAGPGETWSRGKTLGALVTHQIHHRGQLTIVMRLNGLKVPGNYGPSKEEWAEYGLPAQE